MLKTFRYKKHAQQVPRDMYLILTESGILYIGTSLLAHYSRQCFNHDTNRISLFQKRFDKSYIIHLVLAQAVIVRMTTS